MQAIEARISRLPGVISVYANPVAEVVFVEYDPLQIGMEQFLIVIRDVGVKAAPKSHSPATPFEWTTPSGIARVHQSSLRSE